MRHSSLSSSPGDRAGELDKTFFELSEHLRLRTRCSTQDSAWCRPQKKLKFSNSFMTFDGMLSKNCERRKNENATQKLCLPPCLSLRHLYSLDQKKKPCIYIRAYATHTPSSPCRKVCPTSTRAMPSSLGKRFQNSQREARVISIEVRRPLGPLSPSGRSLRAEKRHDFHPRRGGTSSLGPARVDVSRTILNRLVASNVTMALFHLTLLILTVSLGNLDLAAPVYGTNIEFVDTNTTSGLAFELVPTYSRIGTIPLTWITAAFFLCSAVAHAGRARDPVETVLQRRI